MILRAICAAVTIGIAGCQASQSGPYAGQSAEKRDTARASELNRRAADFIHSDPKKAEELLRESLTHDLHFGPAHNNLGILFLERGNLYEASSEFEWARKLMPGHPDPRINLAIALERGGQIEEAIASYEAVLELRPELQTAMVGLASTQLRHRRADGRTHDLLNRIAEYSEDDSTRDWARVQLGKMNASTR